MKIFSTIGINRKKLKYRTGKALFLILPIIVLVAISVVATSQVKNIRKAMNDHIFKEIQSQGTVLEVEYPRESFQPGSGGPSQASATQSEYTEADLVKIKSITNVTDASINSTLPVTTVKTSDLFTDKTLSFRSLSSLNEAMASLYTQENFTYTDGEAIPIILNARQFNILYEDWGDTTTYTIDFSQMRDMNRGTTGSTSTTDTLQSSSPIKTSAVTYTKDELLGKEFTITFGGFSDIADYSISRDGSTTTMTKLSTSAYNALITARKSAVNKYWNYDMLSTGVSYKFKVVGVIESNDNSNIFIPEAAANKVMSDYVNLQLSSRRTTSIPTTVLNNTYTGLTYNGTELLSASTARSFGGGGFGMGRPGEDRPGSTSSSSSSSSTTSYEIPGLVIEVDENDSNDIVGVYTDAGVYEDAVQTGDRISIKINDYLNRAQVVENLNTNGYAYQDTSDYEIFSKVQKTLDIIATAVIVGFIVLTIAVIMFTMSKFVSESKKEIGIFRAVGFTKGNILSIFLVQSIMYVAVGYIIGLGIGFGANLLASRFVAKWFDSFVNNTVKQTFDVVGSVNNSVFNRFDAQSMLILTGILFAVTVIISFVPAFRASNVSPVEAIKSE